MAELAVPGLVEVEDPIVVVLIVGSVIPVVMSSVSANTSVTVISSVAIGAVAVFVTGR